MKYTGAGLLALGGAVAALFVATAGTTVRAPAGVVPRGTVTCDSSVEGDSPAAPSADYRVLFNRVAIVKEGALVDPARTPLWKPFRFWVKSGLLVRQGRTPVGLIVPGGWRDRFALEWGDSRIA